MSSSVVPSRGELDALSLLPQQCVRRAAALAYVGGQWLGLYAHPGELGSGDAAGSITHWVERWMDGLARVVPCLYVTMSAAYDVRGAGL